MNIKSVGTYALIATISVLVGGGTGFFAASPSTGQQPAQDMMEALEAQTGQDLELLKTQREKGMLKVDVKTQNDQIQTYYTSPTGDLFFREAGATDPERLKTVVESRQNLGECLQRKQAVIYGNLTQRATRLQVRSMGQRNLGGVYADVNNASVLRTAAQQGVQRTPAVVYNGSVLSGVNTPNRIADFTGCEFDTG